MGERKWRDGGGPLARNLHTNGATRLRATHHIRDNSCSLPRGGGGKALACCNRRRTASGGVSLLGDGIDHGRDRERDVKCFHSRKADKACTALAEEVLEEVGELRKCAAGGGEGVRYVLAIAGCPGSGKSTLAKRLCSKINCRAEDQQAIATVVPMDGFHHTRAELDEMHRPELAHKRRGSHWTFDSEAFVESVMSITEPGSEASFPSFDHGIGDPVPEAIRVESYHQIVIVEGLYLLLDVPPWNDLYAHFDKRCFIKCPIGLALQRVMHRKVKTLGENPIKAKAQVDFNDKKNAITVWKTRKRADLMIPT